MVIYLCFQIHFLTNHNCKARSEFTELPAGCMGVVWVTILYIYRPQRSCEGYVFTGICLSTGRGAWSREGYPLLGGGAWSQGGVCSWGVSAPGGAWSRGGLVPGVAWSHGGLVSQHALRQTPPGETATAADGTHPTGMNFCKYNQTFPIISSRLWLNVIGGCGPNGKKWLTVFSSISLHESDWAKININGSSKWYSVLSVVTRSNLCRKKNQQITLQLPIHIYNEKWLWLSDFQTGICHTRVKRNSVGVTRRPPPWLCLSIK